VSPVAIPDDPRGQTLLTLEHLYDSPDMLFIGQRMEGGAMGPQQLRPAQIKSRDEWLDLLHGGNITTVPELIVPNPLTGALAPNADGSPGYRGDAAVAVHRFVVVEFDRLPIVQQMQFWSYVKLPVVALIHSGGKSLHAWVRVDAADEAEWRSGVSDLYSFLVPLGADPHCKTPARLSRCPGGYRAEKQAFQGLLYLAPEGRAVR
jgi:hypothetical protein